MTEEELLSFIKNPNNKESKTLEYKLKPNFNEIEKNIEPGSSSQCNYLT